MKTLYEFATDKMIDSISTYFAAVEETDHFTRFEESTLNDEEIRYLLLAGKSLDPEGITASQAKRELERVLSIPFDVEQGASYSVYRASRAYIRQLMIKANEISSGYSALSAEDVAANSYLLPIWQQLWPYKAKHK